MNDTYQVLVTKMIYDTPHSVKSGSDGDIYDLIATDDTSALKEAERRFGDMLSRGNQELDDQETFPLGHPCLVLLKNGNRHKQCYVFVQKYRWYLCMSDDARRKYYAQMRKFDSVIPMFKIDR